MAQSELIFDPPLLDLLHAHASEGYPHEVVGILAGDPNGRVRAVASLRNERADRPADRYQVSGLVVAQSQSALEAQGYTILGYYHSHPDHPAQYSDFDRDHALPNLSYVIVSVRAGVPVDTRSWRLREDRSAMNEQALRIEESA